MVKQEHTKKHKKVCLYLLHGIQHCLNLWKSSDNLMLWEQWNTHYWCFPWIRPWTLNQVPLWERLQTAWRVQGLFEKETQGLKGEGHFWKFWAKTILLWHPSCRICHKRKVKTFHLYPHSELKFCISKALSCHWWWCPRLLAGKQQPCLVGRTGNAGILAKPEVTCGSYSQWR